MFGDDRLLLVASSQYTGVVKCMPHPHLSSNKPAGPKLWVLC